MLQIASTLSALFDGLDNTMYLLGHKYLSDMQSYLQI